MQDIFVCHDGNRVRSRNSECRQFLSDLGRGTGKARSMTLANHRSRACTSLQVVRKAGQREGRHLSSLHPVILFVGAKDQIVGDVITGRKSIHWVQRQEFVGHDQIIQ